MVKKKQKPEIIIQNIVVSTSLEHDIPLIKLAEVDFPTTAVNLGTGKGKSLSEVIAVIREHMPNMKVEHAEKFGHPIENSRADVSLLRELTGWTPPTPLEVGIRKVIEYEREKSS